MLRLLSRSQPMTQLPLLARVVSGLLLCGALIAAMGCGKNYDDATLLEELSQDTPEFELEDSHYVYTRTESRIIRVSAARVESFESNNTQRFWGLTFAEVDENNDTLNIGSADYAIYHVDQGNFELMGNVYFDSIEHDAIVTTQFLIWNNDEQKLHGNDTDLVTIMRSSGTNITGKNLMADLNRREIIIEETSGIIYPDSDDSNDSEINQ